MSRALTQHGLKAAVKTDACSTLVSLNIFAGTEHDSANYGKVQESFRKHTAETANKGRAPPKGKTKGYSLEPVEAIQPTSVEWERGSTTEEVREGYSLRWDAEGFMRGNSYKRDSMGRYSRDDGYSRRNYSRADESEHAIEQLEEMLKTAGGESEHMAIKKAISILKNA